jgi:pSer/pThr/pTyr-binding forkhead associated (FHA) protein
MKVAGGNRDKIFNHDAIEEIHRLCFGIPRLINTLCDTALLTCLAEEKRKVTLDVIDSAVQELRWQWIEDRDADEEVVSSIDRESSKTNSPINLMVYRSGQFVEQVQPTHFPFVLGRSNANDMVIIDKEVSRRHALIDCIGGIYVVEDLNSKNGILVNRKQRSRALLRSGDIVSFGQIDVAFYNNAAESTANIPTKLPPAPMREDDENDENDENSEQDADPSSTVNDLTKITDKKQA